MFNKSGDIAFEKIMIENHSYLLISNYKPGDCSIYADSKQIILSILDNIDYGCTYYKVFCRYCNNNIGKVYNSVTKSHLD